MDDADRRDYFRIADHVLLDYRVVTARTADEGAAADFFPPCHAFDLMRQLRLLEQEYGASRPASDQARDHDPALRLLHRKVDLVAASLVAVTRKLQGEAQPLPVVLSEGGLAFPTDEPLAPGTLLALQIQLLPEWLGLHLHGEVIHDQPPRQLIQPEWERFDHQAAVHFIRLRESDRQLLARHILKRQVEERRQRQQED